MKTVKLRNWFADLAPPAGLGLAQRSYLYYSRRRAFSPATFFILMTALSGGLAFFNRAGTVAFFTLLIFGAYLFVMTHAVARGLQLKRIAPARAHEGETLTIEYEITNPSAFKASDILITDHFAGSKQAEETVWLDEPISAFRTYRGSYKKVCDAGMGVFAYGPLVATVSDPLGIFQFRVTEDEKRETSVFPRLTPLENLPIRGSKESFNFGIYDVAARGLSSNFIGVRGYERGDSLRHVSWKLSMKARKLLVKEFEKSVNAEIALILDMSAKSQMGWKADSTWEYSKDIALSIMAREMANGNNIQLFSNRSRIGSGGGESHYLSIIKAVFDLRPESDDEVETGVADLVARAGTVIARGTTAVYIGPVFHADFARLEASLIGLFDRSIDVIAVLLDAGSFVEGRIQGTMKMPVNAEVLRARQLLKATAHRLSAAGVLTYVIANQSDIGRVMLRPYTEAQT